LKAAPHGAAKRSGLYWIGGRLCEAGTGDVRLAPLADAGCYTSARVTNGRALFSSLHCRRLQRDGRLLDLGGPAEESVLRIFSELGRAVFGRATGIVRVDLRRGGGPTGQLFGSTRALGAEPVDWRAAIAPLSHPGPGAAPGAKCSASPSHESARRYAREHGLDECLLLDSEECLVEGSRSNLLIVSATGELLAPEAARGAVAGIALSVLRERGPTPREAAIDVTALRSAREIIALNAVRGARAICRLDDRDVGTGRAGPSARRIATALAEAAGIQE